MSRSDKSGSKFGGKFGRDSGHDPFAGQDPFASVPDVDERLADWVDGTMSPRDRGRFEAEMRVSPHLRDQVADYEGTVASIREALNDETHETNLADRVMASLAQEASGTGKRARSGWPFVWAVMSAAALLGIAILIDSWGGTMLAAKTATDTTAHLESPANALTEDSDSKSLNEVGEATPAKRESSLETVKIESVVTGGRSENRPKKTLPEIFKIENPGDDTKPGNEPLVVSDPGAMSNGEVVKDAVPPPGAALPGGSGGSAKSQSAGSASIGSPGLKAGNGGAIRTGGRPAGVGRDPATKPQGGKPSIGAASVPPPVETTLEVSVESEAAYDGPRDSVPPGSAAIRGRQMGQARNGRDREYLMRLSEQKSVGEVLPLVTLEGLAVRFELAKEADALLADRERAESQAEFDDFYLGSTAKAQALVLGRFFDTQMRPEVEWSQAERNRDEVDVATHEQLDAGIVSIGGLQLFAVGPAASEAKAKPLDDVSKSATPGERVANGGGLEQRDWLVVGPRSEVAKLLIALRKYSDNVKTRQCRTGEVRLVKPDLKRGDGAGRGALEPSATPGKPKALRVPAVSDPASEAKPSATANPSPAVSAEPTQRVVIRFRVRR
jgi:hypothetical protein